jgi:hypothetical protein
VITTNPFAELAAVIPPAAMQTYVVLMVLLAAGGTILDILHKKSAKYFFENAKRAQQSATRSVGGGDKVGIALKTVGKEVLTSGEFANPQRRMSHLLTMYGFILLVVTTLILIFGYPAEAAPAVLPLLWHLGAAMLAAGGYWFWFVIRVDVSSEGHPWYRVNRADLFIVSLLATATFALLWSFTQGFGAIGWLFFVLFVAATTALFGTVYWSKFAHMFFKPAAAYQKRITKADGSAENLPTLSRAEPEQQRRHSMELLRDAPMDMGLGIKREAPNHY